jgi:nicotinamide phosphoribosyltransferase
MKATYVEVNGEGREIFKDPITDDGVKKSAKGLLCVTDIDGELVLSDMVDWDHENMGELQLLYEDGIFYNTTTLTEVRNLLKKG